MSKLKPSEVDKQNDIIYKNIRARCATYGILSNMDCAEKIGMTKSLFHRRQHNGKWQSDELVHAAQALKVPITWFFVEHINIGKDMLTSEH